MIVCFGSINLDLIFPLPHLPRTGETVLGTDMRTEPGGKGANQAVAARRDGAETRFVGAVGRDGFAVAALATMRADDVDLAQVQECEAPTGTAAICVDAAGHNQIAVSSGANMRATAAQVPDSWLSPETTLLLQAENDLAQTATLIRTARAAGSRIVMNLAPAAALASDALRAIDVLVVNEEEGAWLAAHLQAEPGARGLSAALGGSNVVVTRGGDGLEAAGGDISLVLPAHAVAVVDTTAAGDCFCGVLAAGLDRGLALEAAIRRANMAAALACSRAGSQDSLPRQHETDAALARQ